MSFQENLELAGMTNEESGLLKGAIHQDFEIWIPPKTIEPPLINKPVEAVTLEVRGSEEEIIFYVPREWVEKDKPAIGPTKLKEISWIKKENTSKLLDDFISLADASGDRYLALAKKWGPLWERNNENIPSYLLPDSCLIAPWIESVETWRNYARITKCSIEIAAYLINDKLAPEELWLDLLEDYKAANSLPEQRFMLSFFINMQITDEYDVKYSFDWSKDTPKIKLQSRLGFINALWFQLIQAITLQNLFICDGCHRPYNRKERKPKLNQNNYCGPCRRSSVPKLAYYHRDKEEINKKRRLKKEG